jgi:hypothetical protein
VHWWLLIHSSRYWECGDVVGLGRLGDGDEDKLADK